MCNDLGDTVGDCEVSGDGGLLWLLGWDLQGFIGSQAEENIIIVSSYQLYQCYWSIHYNKKTKWLLFFFTICLCVPFQQDSEVLFSSAVLQHLRKNKIVF